MIPNTHVKREGIMAGTCAGETEIGGNPWLPDQQDLLNR